LKDKVQTLTQEKATLVTEKMETDQGKDRLEGVLTDLQTQKHAVDVALATALRGKKKATLLFREKESALRASAAENASQAGQLEESTERVARLKDALAHVARTAASYVDLSIPLPLR